MTEGQEIARKKKHRKQASSKQITALNLYNQGMTKGEALKRAGYSESMQRVPQKVFTSQAIVTMIDKFKLELKDQGLTTQYWAEKMKQWAEDGTIKEQQDTFRLFKELTIDAEAKKPDENLKRRLTLEEYISTPGTTNPENTDNSGEEIEVVQLPHIQDIPSEPDIPQGATEEGELIL